MSVGYLRWLFSVLLGVFRIYSSGSFFATMDGFDEDMIEGLHISAIYFYHRTSSQS